MEQMTYEEFKKVVEFLDIKFVQVVVDIKTEYSKFQDLDLFSEQSDIFEEIEETLNVGPEDTGAIAFWLDPYNDFKIERYQDLDILEDFSSDYLFGCNETKNWHINRIVLGYDKFIDLIS